MLYHHVKAWLALAAPRLRSTVAWKVEFRVPVYKYPRTAVLLAMAVAAAAPSIAAATDASNDAPVADGVPLTTLKSVVVTAQRLDEARAGIETQTGASTYTIDSAEINAEPGGQNVQLNQVLLQAPDVVQDSFGQLHVRGDHNDLQYRLNGIILPEGISVFSQTLDPRLIASLNLVTGALPAEYGLETAGIIDLTTQSGLLKPAATYRCTAAAIRRSSRRRR